MASSELDTLHIWALEQLIDNLKDEIQGIVNVNIVLGESGMIHKVINEITKIKSERTKP